MTGNQNDYHGHLSIIEILGILVLMSFQRHTNLWLKNVAPVFDKTFKLTDVKIPQ